MLDIGIIKKTLYDWASNAITPIPVIFYQQNAPRPALPYVTLYLQSWVSIGKDYQGLANNQGISEIFGNREFTLQVQCYGGEPFNTLETLKMSVSKINTLNFLSQNGIAFVRNFSIIDVTSLLDTEFEPRASLDFVFRVAQFDQEDNGLIEIVEIEETFNDAEKTVYNKTVTIEK